MKTKACVLAKYDGVATDLQSVFSSAEFTEAILNGIIRDIFGVKDVEKRPAEYYVQDADRGHALSDISGVEIRMTGISRNGRTPKSFHEALKKLETIAATFATKVVQDEMRIQVFCVLMLDGEIETSAGSGEYSNVLEGNAFTVVKPD